MKRHFLQLQRKLCLPVGTVVSMFSKTVKITCNICSGGVTTVTGNTNKVYLSIALL